MNGLLVPDMTEMVAIEQAQRLRRRYARCQYETLSSKEHQAIWLQISRLMQGLQPWQSLSQRAHERLIRVESRRVLHYLKQKRHLSDAERSALLDVIYYPQYVRALRQYPQGEPVDISPMEMPVESSPAILSSRLVGQMTESDARIFRRLLNNPLFCRTNPALRQWAIACLSLTKAVGPAQQESLVLDNRWAMELLVQLDCQLALGLPADAKIVTYSDCKAAYLRIAKWLHPDVSQLPESEATVLMQEVNRAFSIVRQYYSIQLDLKSASAS